MVYAHQHVVASSGSGSNPVAKNVNHTAVHEKCSLCDVMHHNAMVASSHVFFNPVFVSGHVFESVSYSFKSIQLILSGGRAPPSSSYMS